MLNIYKPAIQSFNILKYGWRVSRDTRQPKYDLSYYLPNYEEID